MTKIPLKSICTQLFVVLFLVSCEKALNKYDYLNQDISVTCNSIDKTGYINCAKEKLIAKEQNLSEKEKKFLHNNYIFFRKERIKHTPVKVKDSKFESIKQCFEKDKCEDILNGSTRKHDEYNNTFFIITLNGPTIDCIHNNQNYRCGTAVGYGVNQFLYSKYNYSLSDTIAASEKNKIVLFSPVIETVRINKDKKIFIHFNIVKNCQEKIKKDKRYLFNICEIYSFSDLLDIPFKPQDISISLDRRDNPSKIYIKFLDKAYEFDIPHTSKEANK